MGVLRSALSVGVLRSALSVGVLRSALSVGVVRSALSVGVVRSALFSGPCSCSGRGGWRVLCPYECADPSLTAVRLGAHTAPSREGRRPGVNVCMSRATGRCG